MHKETQAIVDAVEFRLDVIDCTLTPGTKAEVLEEALAEITEMITMRLLEDKFSR